MSSIPKGFKAQVGQDRRSEPQGPSDLHVVSYIGVSWVETSKHCNRNREIMKRDIPMTKRIVWDHKSQ
jgi:hypothetical protein